MGYLLVSAVCILAPIITIIALAIWGVDRYFVKRGGVETLYQKPRNDLPDGVIGLGPNYEYIFDYSRLSKKDEVHNPQDWNNPNWYSRPDPPQYRGID